MAVDKCIVKTHLTEMKTNVYALGDSALIIYTAFQSHMKVTAFSVDTMQILKGDVRRGEDVSDEFTSHILNQRLPIKRFLSVCKSI